jgi:hypothetical protein
MKEPPRKAGRFNPYFWTVLLNQGPAVEKQLVNMNETRHAFKVDVSTRTVHFKVEHG